SPAPTSTPSPPDHPSPATPAPPSAPLPPSYPAYPPSPCFTCVFLALSPLTPTTPQTFSPAQCDSFSSQITSDITAAAGAQISDPFTISQCDSTLISVCGSFSPLDEAEASNLASFAAARVSYWMKMVVLGSPAAADAAVGGGGSGAELTCPAGLKGYVVSAGMGGDGSCLSASSAIAC
ncbi:hypothetical protein Agub_g5597, partial [Astrephomene gubernaculifera]